MIMSLQLRAVDEVKAQLHNLIDQLSAEQLLRLHQLLRRQFFVNGKQYGGEKNDTAVANDALNAEQPWLKYTAQLKESPHWDEFLAAVAKERQESTCNEDQV
jgi:hypothetical protein